MSMHTHRRCSEGKLGRYVGMSRKMQCRLPADTSCCDLQPVLNYWDQWPVGSYFKIWNTESITCKRIASVQKILWSDYKEPI